VFITGWFLALARLYEGLRRGRNKDWKAGIDKAKDGKQKEDDDSSLKKNVKVKMKVRH